MKAMFLMDFVTVKKLLRRYLLLLLGVGGLAALMMGSHPGIVPYFGELSVISVAQALALYDDRRDWSRFRLTMPLTRTGVVLGRYAFLAAVAVAGTLMGVALYLVVTLAVQEVMRRLRSAWAASTRSGSPGPLPCRLHSRSWSGESCCPRSSASAWETGRATRWRWS